MLKSISATKENVEKTGLYHRVSLPEGKEQEKLPGVFMVHGRAGDASLMWVFLKVLQGLNFKVIAPQAPVQDPVGSYSWWLIDDSALRAKESDILESVEDFKKFVDSSVEVYNLDPDKLFAFGFSQGAALLGVLSLKYPDVFKAVGMLASFIPGFAFKNLSVPGGELPRYFMFNGTEDKIITFDQGEETRDALLRCGANVEFHQDDVGHKVSSSGIKALGEWIKTRM